MRIAVVGAGAMGGSLAAHAARAGHDVSVIDVSRPVVDHIAAEGLHVTAPDGEFVATPAATDDPATVGVVDAVVVFVKAQHTEAAARSLTPLIGPDTVIATLQNGWGNADVIAGDVPPDRLVVGVTYNSCTADGPGRVKHSGSGPTVLGPYAGDDLAGAERLAAALTQSGWAASTDTAVRTQIWKKLVLNAATLPTASLSRLSAGAVGAHAELLEVVDALAAEAVAVALALDLDIDLAERMEAIHATLARAGDGRPSMLQDVLAGRKTEVETVNGAVVAAGDRLDVPVPLNRAMLALVHALEGSYLS